MFRRFLSSAALLTTAACGGEADTAATTEPSGITCTHDDTAFDPGFSVERIDLRSGDVSGVTHEPDAEHVLLLPGHRELRPELFVWLPGTGAQPSGYEAILNVAAFAGYRTIGLAYVNDVQVTSLCEGSDDPDCSFALRMENQTGEDVSAHIDVGAVDSIDARLTALLGAAATARPDDGWGDFLADGAPDWSRIVVAGHSQGGGQTAFISHQQSVVRAVHFSNPGDGLGDGNAPWTLESRATSADRLFVLFHVEEGSADRIPELAEATGMSDFGGPVGIDDGSPPYDCSHVLSTDTPVASAQDAHRAVAADSAVPRDEDGLPLHMPAWRYLFTVSHD